MRFYPTIEEKLEQKKIIKPSPFWPNTYPDCWWWTGDSICKDNPSRNYGIMLIEGKRHRVHRVSASIHLDFDLNSELEVCHHCDNPICFNPNHLFIGNKSKNMKDMWDKGIRSL